MISIQGAVLRNPAFRFREPVTLTIEAGEQVAIVGPNGSGKSVLAKMITGFYPLREGNITYAFSPSPVYENIKLVAFKDSYGPMDASYYLQQRWNSQDRDSSPPVRDTLGNAVRNSLQKQLFELFGIEEMLDKPLVLLSSGEMRKFQLTKALLTGPRVLIIDNPFIGLDASTRDRLCGLLDHLTAMGTVQVILLLAGTDEIPAFITHIVPVRDRICRKKVSRVESEESIWATPVAGRPSLSGITDQKAGRRAGNDSGEMIGCRPAGVRDTYVENLSGKEGDTVIGMKNISVRYGECTILKSLNWTVERGEKWALLGRNGSGKSALLSLVCADNPQSYACDMTLFGRQRGSGESIWEIKKRIGYVSPEMQRAYSENLPVIDIVASGLHDTVGLYAHIRPEEYVVCSRWMDLFGITSLRRRNFLQLSDGEQRMVLLTRAFVKDPELLILDEPMHGLDPANRLLAHSVIETFGRRADKTLILVTHYEQDLPACITHRLVLEKST